MPEDLRRRTWHDKPRHGECAQARRTEKASGMYELRASIFLPRLDSTERSCPCSCHVSKSALQDRKPQVRMGGGSRQQRRKAPHPCRPHSEQSPAARPHPGAKEGRQPASSGSERPCGRSGSSQNRQNSGPFPRPQESAWPSHYAPTQRDPRRPSGPGGHSGLSTHLSRGHRVSSLRPQS